MGLIVAIDIGGTQLRVAIYPNDSTTPIRIEKTATRGMEEGVQDRLYEIIDTAWPKESVDAISVAAPGPVNPYKGKIIYTPNIPAWKNYPLAELLTKRYHVPTFLGNDANLATLGEWKYGSGRGHHDVVYITISTGIGGGVICRDMLIEGSSGMATELGHITVLPDGPVCSCGVRGHLEAVASGPAIVRFVSEEIVNGFDSSLAPGTNLTARLVAEAAKKGDALAREAFNRAGSFIGQAVADFLHIFNPSIVIFGGGVTQSGGLILEPIKESMRSNIMNPSYMDGLVITTVKLGDEAGLLGALAQAQIKLVRDKLISKGDDYGTT
jgi:glucokinase